MDAGTSLGSAIRNARGALSQPQLRHRLAERGVSVNQTTVSKWERGTTAPALDTIRAIEEVLGLHRGWILIAAGLVELPQTARQAIEADSALTADTRAVVLAAYDVAVSASAKTRASTPPTT
jgi:transcriptional regulator with XRE-family HTH domain